MPHEANASDANTAFALVAPTLTALLHAMIVE
jgi:hypothetical protein